MSDASHPDAMADADSIAELEQQLEENRDPMKRAIAQSVAILDGRAGVYVTDWGVDFFLRELRARGFDVKRLERSAND